jgi:hypothetical protein
MKDEIKVNHDPHCCPIEAVYDDDIAALLLTIFQTDKPATVTFLNFYKEVAIVSPIESMSAVNGCLTCKATEVQGRAIANSNNTIIRSTTLRHDVLAKARYRYDSKDVVLSELVYVDVLTDRRASVRVKIDFGLPLRIEAGQNRFAGTMLELSLNGCAVDITDAALLEHYKYFYLNIEMPFVTFKGSNNTRIMAKLIRGEQIGKNYRCIFVFEHDNTTEDQIGRLLTQRQTGIIRELR